MARCPCKSRRCTCVVDGDGGIQVSGNGGGRQPYKPTWNLWNLVGGDTSQANVTVTGSGTSGDPWVVSITTLGGSIEQTVYEADDTWVKGGGTVAMVVVIGGGGGGGSSAAVRPAGGSGGSGGAMSVGWFPIDDLPDTVDIKVGDGGLGGRPFSGETTGETGGDSWFGEFLYAAGGRGGGSQASGSQTQYPTLGGTPHDGGPGGAGSVRDGSGSLPAEDHFTFLSPTGGGLGEGSSIAETLAGLIGPGKTWAGQGGDGASAGPGPDFFDFPGQPGELYGGGGGGGSAKGGGSAGPPGPLGGSGAQGVVVVTVW